ALLLGLFYALDWYFYHCREPGGAEPEERAPFLDPTPDTRALSIEGTANFLLLALVVGLVLMSGLWKPGIEFSVFGTPVELQNAVRDVALLGLACLSLAVTPRSARVGNAFNWAPMEEVAKLFAGIFVTIAPVIVMLRARDAGAFAGIAPLVNDASGQ